MIIGIVLLVLITAFLIAVRKDLAFECVLCKDLKENFPLLIQGFKEDFKSFFNGKFTSENYYKHLLYSMLIGSLLELFLMYFCHLAETQLIFRLFIPTLALFGVNAFRESYYASEPRNNPFSWGDVRFGTYGGFLGGVLICFIVYKFNLFG